VKHPTLVAIQNKSFTVILNLSPIVVILNVVKDPVFAVVYSSHQQNAATLSAKN